MNNLKSAAKLALELLKSAHVSTDLVWKRHDCVQALEEALKQEPDYSICPSCGGMADDPIVPPEHRQPKQEQGEPVAVIERGVLLDVRFTNIERALKLPDGTKLYTKEQL